MGTERTAAKWGENEEEGIDEGPSIGCSFEAIASERGQRERGHDRERANERPAATHDAHPRPGREKKCVTKCSERNRRMRRTCVRRTVALHRAEPITRNTNHRARRPNAFVTAPHRRVCVQSMLVLLRFPLYSFSFATSMFRPRLTARPLRRRATPRPFLPLPFYSHSGATVCLPACTLLRRDFATCSKLRRRITNLSLARFCEHLRDLICSVFSSARSESLVRYLSLSPPPLPLALSLALWRSLTPHHFDFAAICFVTATNANRVVGCTFFQCIGHGARLIVHVYASALND